MSETVTPDDPSIPKTVFQCNLILGGLLFGSVTLTILLAGLRFGGIMNNVNPIPVINGIPLSVVIVVLIAVPALIVPGLILKPMLQKKLRQEIQPLTGDDRQSAIHSAWMSYKLIVGGTTEGPIILCAIFFLINGDVPLLFVAAALAGVLATKFATSRELEAWIETVEAIDPA